MERHFKCPICFYFVKDAVECCGCHKLYCEACSKQLSQCGICMKAVGFSPSFPSRQLVEGDVKTDCPNKKCTESPTRANLQEHLKKCQFQVITCPHEGCTMKFEKNLQEVHKEECLYGKVECENLGCSAVILRNDIKAHVSKTCKFRIEACPIDGCSFDGTVYIVGHHIVDNHCDFFASKIFPSAKHS